MSRKNTTGFNVAKLNHKGRDGKVCQSPRYHVRWRDHHGV